MYYQGLINTFREYLPVSDKTPVITLNEGNTPLIKAENLAKKIGLDAEIYLKFEGCNPTGSFKFVHQQATHPLQQPHTAQKPV